MRHNQSDSSSSFMCECMKSLYYDYPIACKATKYKLCYALIRIRYYIDYLLSRSRIRDAIHIVVEHPMVKLCFTLPLIFVNSIDFSLAEIHHALSCTTHMDTY